MLRIACLGWGSLVWNPGTLKLKGAWKKDGPLVRVEFLRKSDTRTTTHGRITLVLNGSATPVPAQWAIMDYPDLPSAIEGLRVREGKTYTRNIGSWTKGRSPRNIVDLPAWARHHKIDAVVWTALGPDFDGSPRKRTEKQIVRYLQGLTGENRVRAEEYIRYTPKQITTAYRRRIEAVLGWTPKKAPKQTKPS